jgi:hypothetical protein
MEDRDMKVLEFVSLVRVCTREQVQQMFFKDVHQNVAMRRLKYLSDADYIRRDTYNLDKNKRRNAYVYYMDRKPGKKIVKHDLIVTDVIVKFIQEGYEIIEFERSCKIGNIIPDALIKIKKNGRVKRIILEVQISPNDCLSKYHNFREVVIENTNWQVMPVLYVVNNQNLNKKLNDIKVVYDNLNLEKVGDFID